MVTMSASVDGGSLKGVNDALTGFMQAMGDAAGNMPKKIARDLCTSLGVRTAKAKRKKKRSDWGAEPIHHTSMVEFQKNGRRHLVPTPSPYITNPRNGRHGLSNGLVLHRYMFTTRKGTFDERTFPVAAYSHLKHTKRGKIVTDKAAELRELREIHALNYQSGLAANSWKWIRRAFSSAGTDPVYRKRKNDRRDPKKSVSGSCGKKANALTAAGWAEIHNHLDFIRSAISDVAIDDAIRADISKIVFKTARARNMTPEEAKAYAREVAAGLVESA